MSETSRQLRAALRPHAGWAVLIAALALTAIGIDAIGGGSHEGHAARQTQWLVISLIAMLVVVVPHPKWLSLLSWPLMVVLLVMLAILIVPGMPRGIVVKQFGARSWINLHFMHLQPSELAKVVFVMGLARYLRYRENYRTLTGLLPPFVIMFVPMFLIIWQPDPGTALLFVPPLFAVLIAAGARAKHIWLLVGLGVLFIAVNIGMIFYLPDTMQLLKEHQRNRIISVASLSREESRYLSTTGFQQNTAKNLIGAGGVTGYAASDSAMLVRLNELPKDHNDMAFAVVVNRWGLLGGMTVMGLYLLMVCACLLVAGRSKDPFVRLSTVGFAGLIAAQAAINIGMNIGLLPIIGITLPFISYGGSSLVASFLMVGMVINFASRRAQILARPSFEFDNPDAIFQ